MHVEGSSQALGSLDAQGNAVMLDTRECCLRDVTLGGELRLSQLLKLTCDPHGLADGECGVPTRGVKFGHELPPIVVRIDVEHLNVDSGLFDPIDHPVTFAEPRRAQALELTCQSLPEYGSHRPARRHYAACTFTRSLRPASRT